MKLSIAVGALLFALVQPVAAEALSSKDIRKLAPGRYAVSVPGAVITVSLRPNGMMTGSSQGEKDSGRWSVRGNQLCVAWNNWYFGKQRCSSLKGKNGSYAGSGVVLRKI